MSFKLYKIKNFSFVVTGYTPSTSIKENYESNDYMFIGPVDLKNNRFITGTQKYISSFAFKKSIKRVLKKGDVVVDCIGSDMGNVGIITDFCISNQQINAITQIDAAIINNIYLYYLLSTKKSFFHQIGMNGSTMPIISKTLFENIELNIHDLNTQQHIVNTIGSVDDLIEQKQQIISKLIKKSTLMYELYKTEVISSNPLFLINCCEIKTGKLNAIEADENGIYPFFTCGKKELQINSFAFDGDLIVIAGNGEISVKYYNGKCNAYQRTYMLTPSKYFYLFLKECELRIDELVNISQGSVIKFITKSMLENISIYLNKNASELNDKIKDIYTYINHLQKELKLLEKLKKYMLIKYF